MKKTTNKKSLIKKLRKLAKDQAKLAYSPYSKAKVGSALLTDDGAQFTGCNIENASFGGTVCAERVAIWKAISERGPKIKLQMIYVYTEQGWPPCGLCRQVIAEFSDEGTEVVIGDKEGEEQCFLFLRDLYPHNFNPKHLGKA